MRLWDTQLRVAENWGQNMWACAQAGETCRQVVGERCACAEAGGAPAAAGGQAAVRMRTGRRAPRAAGQGASPTCTGGGSHAPPGASSLRSRRPPDGTHAVLPGAQPSVGQIASVPGVSGKLPEAADRAARCGQDAGR